MRRRAEVPKIFGGGELKPCYEFRVAGYGNTSKVRSVECK